MRQRSALNSEEIHAILSGFSIGLFWLSSKIDAPLGASQLTAYWREVECFVWKWLRTKIYSITTIPWNTLVKQWSRGPISFLLQILPKYHQRKLTALVRFKTWADQLDLIMFWIFDVRSLPITPCHTLYAFSQIIATIIFLLNMSFPSNIRVRFPSYHSRRPVSSGVVSRCPGAHYTRSIPNERGTKVEREGSVSCVHVSVAAELIDQLADRRGPGQCFRGFFRMQLLKTRKTQQNNKWCCLSVQFIKARLKVNRSDLFGLIAVHPKM